MTETTATEPTAPAVAIPETFAHYLAAWNEPDVAKVRTHLDLAVADDVVFADPANRTEGIAALEALIATARVDLPTAAYELVSGIDGGHDRRYRYRWVAKLDQDTAVEGMDVTTVDEQGRLVRIDGFFGDFA